MEEKKVDVQVKDVKAIAEKKVMIGVLTIFFAIFGIDQFLMGEKEMGKKTIIRTVIFFIIIIVGWVINAIREIGGIVRGIKYLTMSKEEFEAVIEKGPDFLKWF